MSISIIIPLYNEEGNVSILLSSIYTNLKDTSYELVLIDDGSTDNTLSFIQQNKNEFTKTIVFDKNYGQSAAIKAGIENSTFDTIVIMDGDLQNDAADIKKLLQVQQQIHCKMVQGYRKNRHDNIGKTLPSRAANQLIHLLFGMPIHDIGCSLKVFDRAVVPSFVYFNGFHRYIPLFAFMSGNSLCEKETVHHARHSGKSKYGIGRMTKVIRHLYLFKTKQLNKLPALSYKIKAIL